jgi:Zn-dependent protease
MSTLPESPPSPAPVPTPEQDAPQLAALDPAESEYRAARKLFLEPEPLQQNWLVLLGTIVLFALAARVGEQGWRGVAVLIGVLLFHEFGHWLGMKMFGFQDVRMFFIPFFGAAVSGRNVSAAAWKEALVLLMGPVPGLLAGTFLLVRNYSEPSQWMANVGTSLLLLNAFNMLPLSPLDGGRLFQLLIFSRNRFLELAFTAFAGLGLVGLTFLFESWPLGFVAGLVLFSVPRQWKLLGTVKDLRASVPGVDREPAQLDEISLRALYDSSGALVSKELKDEQRLVQHVRVMRQVHERARMYPPSVLASLGLCFLWGFGVVVMFVGMLALGSGASPAAP